MSLDGFLRVFDARNGELIGRRKAHKQPGCAVVWQPGGDYIATSGLDCCVRFWLVTPFLEEVAKQQLSAPQYCLSWGLMLAAGGADGIITFLDHEGAVIHQLKDSPREINCLAWASDILASAGADKVVRIWGRDSLIATLEGHIAPIQSLSFSADGKLLVSRAGEIRLWRTDTWDGVAAFSQTASTKALGGASFDPRQNCLATLGEDGKAIRVWAVEIEPLLANLKPNSSVRIVNAKVVFVGNSDIGKSCLALRLAEDRYEEQGPTHGMRIWSLPPEKLDPEMKSPANEKRELVLWDLGGHEEYRLIHQLFLHDTTLALVLMNPARGEEAFAQAEEWDNRLENQFKGRRVVKILVGTKHDLRKRSPINKLRVENFITRRNYQGFIEVSALDGHGIAPLKKAIARALDWRTLSRTRRPELFQGIREAIELRKDEGQVVIFFADLVRQIAQEYPETANSQAVSSVIEQLALQGFITQVDLATGDRALILRLDVVDRYAGSLVLLARDNRRGVPAIEIEAIGSSRLILPGIDPSDRLPREKERFLLESVVQLLIERGICLRHEGMLIFPSLFTPTESDTAEYVPHSIVLGYDFSGAIQNIYASLVTALAVGEQFGRMKLWTNRVEFEWASKGVCGIRKVEPPRGRGLAHVDVYFDEGVPGDRKELFVSFVENHLAQSGVNIVETVAVTCRCGFEFPEAVVLRKLSEGQPTVICMQCESRTRISDGAKRSRQRNPDLERETWALRTRVEEKRKEISRSSIRAIGSTSVATKHADYIWVLHLSDFHMISDSSPEVMLHALTADLKDRERGLGIDRLDYLVVSGDLSDRASPAEFELASRLVSKTIDRFRLTAERCIITPGNHDVDWETQVYKWKGRRPGDVAGLTRGTYVVEGNVLGVRDEGTYGDRLKNFSNHLYHPLIQQPYPLNPTDQCVPFLFPEAKLQFLAMNSCWEIDEHNKKRSSINSIALANGLDMASQQIERAQSDGKLSVDDDVLKIAVWHHAITGNDKIEDESFVDHLQKAGVKVVLHGDVHERRDGILNHLDKQRKIHVIGAGAFGAKSSHRPESTPNFYQVLRISRDLKSIRVHTRRKNKENGGWEGWACYEAGEKFHYNTYVDIKL